MFILGFLARGLDVDPASLRRVGGRATIAAPPSLLSLIAINYDLILVTGTA